MSRIRLQSRHSQPFVRLGTIRGMTAVARKLAMVRAAVKEIKDIEERLLSKGATTQQFKQAMEDTASAAKSASKWSSEAAGILNSMRVDVDAFLRDLKNATD